MFGSANSHPNQPFSGYLNINFYPSDNKAVGGIEYDMSIKTEDFYKWLPKRLSSVVKCDLSGLIKDYPNEEVDKLVEVEEEEGDCMIDD